MSNSDVVRPMDERNEQGGGIVIVDDNPDNLHVLSGILQQQGYKVRPAVNGEIAITSIQAVPPELILLDIRMPGIDGYEVCRRLKSDERSRDIPVIFISALLDPEDKLAAFRAGGVDYVTKPFAAEEVLARVQAHLQLYRMQRDLEGVVASRTNELRQTYQVIHTKEQQYRLVLEQTIQAIAMTVEKRDPYTAGHMSRVAQLAVAIASHMGFQGERLDGLRLGSMIHDIGKVAIPAELLNRPGRLSAIEFDIIMEHSLNGHDIIKDVDFPWPVAQMILQHHERLDGSGYPNGISGEEIIDEARIIAVADVVEAMSSHRPYRPALGLDKALEELRRGSGTAYDESVVDALLQLVEQGTIVTDPAEGVRVLAEGTESA